MSHTWKSRRVKSQSRAQPPPAQVIIPRVAEESTLRAAADAHREPFIWISPHHREELLLNTATQANLILEYARVQKPFLLAERGLNGVYPAESHWLLPDKIQESWLRKHFRPVIAISRHLPKLENVFYHTGQRGDIIAALPVMRQLGGGHLVIGNHLEENWKGGWGDRTKLCMEGAAFEGMKSLLEAQPYLLSVRFEHGADHTHDFSTFRSAIRRGDTLTTSQAKWLDVAEVDMSPWILNVKPSEQTRGKIVVARTARYQNEFWTGFTWPDFAQHHGHQMMFIGSPDEHEAFCYITRVRVPRLDTPTLLDVAEAIAGSIRFVGNQSCPCWIAMGLGHPLIQEVSDVAPDSQIHRDNTQFPKADAENRVQIRLAI